MNHQKTRQAGIMHQNALVSSPLLWLLRMHSLRNHKAISLQKKLHFRPDSKTDITPASQHVLFLQKSEGTQRWASGDSQTPLFYLFCGVRQAGLIVFSDDDV